MKVCSRCKKSHSKKHFNKERANKDSLSRWCVFCKAEYKKTYVRSECGKKKDRLTKIKYAKTEAGKESHKKACEKYLNKTNNKNKHRARCAVREAIKYGKIDRPERCERCGSDEKLHGHHSNYERELDVQWVCVPCHVNIHHNLACEEHF